MKQYCRYCCNACLNDDELAYCSYKDEMLEGPALRLLLVLFFATGCSRHERLEHLLVAAFSERK